MTTSSAEGVRRRLMLFHPTNGTDHYCKVSMWYAMLSLMGEVEVSSSDVVPSMCEHLTPIIFPNSYNRR